MTKKKRNFPQNANTTCFAYSVHNNKPYCTALSELFCQTSRCKFYKRKGEENMVTVKKPVVNAKLFEKRMVGVIQLAKVMDMPETTRTILLEELRNVHNGCLEWEEFKPPTNDFEIPDVLNK